MSTKLYAVTIRHLGAAGPKKRFRFTIDLKTLIAESGLPRSDHLTFVGGIIADCERPGFQRANHPAWDKIIDDYPWALESPHARKKEFLKTVRATVMGASVAAIDETKDGVGATMTLSCMGRDRLLLSDWLPEATWETTASPL